MNVVIRRQNRKSLAFTVSEGRALVLIPRSLTADHPTVQTFIAQSFERLGAPHLPTEQHERVEINQLIEKWVKRLNVTVHRVQVRPMTRKWGSMSSTGSLTLSKDLIRLPLELVEYVIVHELMHRKFPHHHKAWQVNMGMYLPKWRSLEKKLQQYAPQRLVD
jgi:hypothetical protein